LTAIGAAYLLAHVRFVTTRLDERNDRVRIDGAIWWRASYADIAASLGISHDVAARLARKLVADGALLSRNSFAGVGDQTKLYRPAVDLPVCESASVLIGQNADSHGSSDGTGADSHGTDADPHGYRRGSAFSIPYRELREVKREGGEAASDTTVFDDAPEPPVFCSLHHPQGANRPCRGCERQYYVEWKPWRDKREAYGRLAPTDAKAASWLTIGRDDAHTRRASIKACDLCDDNGMREIDNGAAVIRCDHRGIGAV
jgi:hypothetical protein